MRFDVIGDTFAFGPQDQHHVAFGGSFEVGDLFLDWVLKIGVEVCGDQFKIVLGLNKEIIDPVYYEQIHKLQGT